MSAATKAPPRAGTKTQGRNTKEQWFYVFDDNQSTGIEQVRYMLRGLSQMAMAVRDAGGALILDAHYQAAIYEMIDHRLGELISPEAVRKVCLDPSELHELRL